MQAPLKASGWWNYKIPPMLAVAYYALAAAPQPPLFGEIRVTLLLFVVAAIGIAGFGHVYLDIFDADEDRILGKSNLWSPLSGVARVLLIAVLLAMSTIPWMFIPFGPVTALLIVLEFVMFFLYATPPIRLKERGFAGIVADALYAHALPALWTLIPFSLIAGLDLSVSVSLVIAAWALVVGMRHLLQHQAIQLDSDKLAGADTAAVRMGRESTLSIVVTRMLPLEAVLFAAVLGVIGVVVPAVPAAFAAYVVWQAFKVRTLWLARFNLFGAMENSDRVTIIGTLVLSRFYERWMPPLILASLAAREHSYLPLLAIHLIVFNSGLIEIFRTDIPLLRAYARSRPHRSAQLPGRSV